MELTYLYECPVHGEMEIQHSIKADRKKQRCPRVIRGRVAISVGPDGIPTGEAGKRYERPCGEKLEPRVIRHDTYRGDVRPAIFVGHQWDFKKAPRWTHGVIDKGKKDPTAVR